MVLPLSPFLRCSAPCHFAMVCGVELRSPPRWFRAAWRARQLSLMLDSLAMRQVIWGYILPIAEPEKILRPDLRLDPTALLPYSLNLASNENHMAGGKQVTLYFEV